MELGDADRWIPYHGLAVFTEHVLTISKEKWRLIKTKGPPPPAPAAFSFSEEYKYL